MAVKIQFKRGTAATAASNNPVLSAGEPGFETDSGKFKIGDGVTAWNALPYAGGSSGGGQAIDEVYANIAAMLADQSNQEENAYYWVTTATADPTVTSGWAIYRKLAASTANLADYVKVQEQESIDIAATPDASETVKGKAEIATQAETDTGTDDFRFVTPLKLAGASKWGLKEDVANKATNFTTLNNSLFPSVQAAVNEMLYFNNIVAVTGAAGTDTNIKTATALDRIPTTGSGAVATGRYVQFIVGDVKYTACLKAGTLAEAAPFIVRANDYATTTNEKYWEVTREFNTTYLPQITGYLGATGSDSSIWQATAVDRIPTTGLPVGTRISAIVTISGTQRRLYTAELVTPADSTAAIELSPSVIRGNDFNSSTNNKVWREIKQSGIIDVSNFGVVPDPSIFVSDQINAIIAAASSGATLVFPPGDYKIFAITVNKKLNFIGIGMPRFIFSTVNANHFIVSVDFTTINGFAFVGQGRSNATYPLQGGLRITSCSNIQVSNCEFDSMPYFAIEANATHVSDQSADFGGINIVNCHFTRNKIGYYSSTRGEYVNIVGCTFADNDTGALIDAGNVNITGNILVDHSTVAIDLTAGSNDGHGIVGHNQINHNVLSIRGVGLVNGHFFRGNNIYYGDMQFTNCTGIEFTANTFEALEMKFDNCTGKIENSTLPGNGGVLTLTTNWNGNQSQIFAFNNKNLLGKLIANWNRSPLLSLYEKITTIAANEVLAKVSLAESEIMVVKGFVMGVRTDSSPNDYTEAYYQPFEAIFRRRATGNIVKVGETLGTLIKDAAFGGSINLNVNTTDQTFELELVPDADDTLWTSRFEYTKSSLLPGLKI